MFSPHALYRIKWRLKSRLHQEPCENVHSDAKPLAAFMIRRAVQPYDEQDSPQMMVPLNVTPSQARTGTNTLKAFWTLISERNTSLEKYHIYLTASPAEASETFSETIFSSNL